MLEFAVEDLKVEGVFPGSVAQRVHIPYYYGIKP